MKKVLFVISMLVSLTITNYSKAEELTSASPVPTKELPKMVYVQIVNATIGPSKFDGSKWSGFGKVNPSVVSQLASLLMKSNPYTGIISLLAGPAISGSGKPSPFGTVDVALNGEYQTKLHANVVNARPNNLPSTYTPIFNMPGYKGIPLNDGTRFKITLYSWHKILSKADPIGVAEINSKDLISALEAQKVYQVSVADQTQNQLLFIGIDVRGMKPINE